MPQPILLRERSASVDPAVIGISYAGAGSYFVIELGMARAFVQKGIRPAFITGVSSGALAATAHALDPASGKGIEVAAELTATVSNRTLGLGVDQVLVRLALQRTHLKSLGDITPLRGLVRQAYTRLGFESVTIGTFQPPDRPRVLIGATDRVEGTSVWFPPETPIEDALVASAAIPGIFQWIDETVAGQQRTLVDGGVITNQPISQLALNGCGTIFACAAGYAGGTLPPPTNALNNALGSVLLMMHQASKLEEDYVRIKTGANVLHVHPVVDFPVHQFDFTPEVVHQVMDAATQKTVEWLGAQGY
jgi:NTE family protein